MNHSYQMVLCHLIVTLPSLTLLLSYEIPELLNPLFWHFSEKTSSGTCVLIQGVECGFVNVPLYNINLSSDLVKGPVDVGIRQTLPFKGVQSLLGSDLAGDKVVVNPLVTDTPCMDQSPDPIELSITKLWVPKSTDPKY